MERILRTSCSEFKMPQKISIGDGLYYNYYKDDKDMLNKLTYNRKFKARKGWLAYIEISEIECNLYDEEDNVNLDLLDDDSKCKETEIKIIMSENENFMRALKKNKRLQQYEVSRKIKLFSDLSSYLIEINKQDTTIELGIDSWFGTAYEFEDEHKNFKGVYITLSGGESSFEDIKEKIEKLLETSLYRIQNDKKAI
ncbi:TPA: hypothetical protein ACSQRE_000149 [Clostridium perfringens]